MRPSKGTTERFFCAAKHFDPVPFLEQAGARGVSALAANTPKDTGQTAAHWSYHITKTRQGDQLEFHNAHISPGGAIVALLLQYGHATRSGTYVTGKDYINPALQPIFDQILRGLEQESKRWR